MDDHAGGQGAVLAPVDSQRGGQQRAGVGGQEVGLAVLAADVRGPAADDDALAALVEDVRDGGRLVSAVSASVLLLPDDRYDEARERSDQDMSGLPRELLDLIASGPMAHLSTINADGSPQVSVVWIGLDGDDLVSGHMSLRAKLRNIERDPRVVLSFDAPRVPGVFLNPYAVLRARAAVQPSDDAWSLLNRLAKVYMSPDAEFPAPEGPGYVVRYSVERIGGVGPWASASR